MLEKLPMPVVYSLRNGEIQISEVILEDVPLNQIRGVMITPKTELLINETYENFENAQAVADFKGGKEKAKQALFGACMRELKNAGDISVIRELLDEKLKNC